MTTFDESKHDRDASGKFTEMAGSEQDDTLAAPAASQSTANTLIAAFQREAEEAWARVRTLREPAVAAATALVAEKYPDATDIQLSMDGDADSEWVRVDGVFDANGELIDIDDEDDETLNTVFDLAVSSGAALPNLPTAQRVEGTESYLIPIPRDTAQADGSPAESAFLAAVNRDVYDYELAGAALRAAGARLYPGADALVFDKIYDEDERLSFSGVRGGQYDGINYLEIPGYDDVDEIVFCMSGGGIKGENIPGIEHVAADTYILQLKG